MDQRRPSVPHASLGVLLLGVVFLPVPALGETPSPLTGYLRPAEVNQRLKKAVVPGVSVLQAIGKTAAGSDVHVLTVGVDGAHPKPAILVVGSVFAPQMVGTELCLRMAERLVQESGKEAGKRLLERHHFYFIPQPNPNAAEACFQPPLYERAVNARQTDDDRDGENGEDPFEDLDRDGMITLMRIADDTGNYRRHPADPRVLVPVDRSKNEKGEYSVHTEGIDNDKDKQFNEDGPGGVSFNRNFTFRYPYFGVAAGPHQVSEEETRAVADFAFAHPNIAVVLSFAPEDNLLQPPKADPAADRQRIKTTVQSADVPIMDYVAGRYQKLLGRKDGPASPRGEGAFSEWAYFHFGRWSFAARGWSPPGVAAPSADKKEASQSAKADGTSEEKPKNSGGPSEKSEKSSSAERPAKASKQEEPSGKSKTARVKRVGDRVSEKPGEAKEAVPDAKQANELVQALKWFDQQKISAFVEWQPIDHPDFPGKKVEVGGIKPFYLLNPPAKELDSLADKHYQFLKELAGLMPQLALTDVKVEKLGAALHRVTVTVSNTSFLPTSSEMGKVTGEPYPLQAKIELPKGAKLVTGSGRTRLEPLGGNGGKAEHRWLIRGAGSKSTATVSVYSPTVDAVSKSVTLP